MVMCIYEKFGEYVRVMFLIGSVYLSLICDCVCFLVLVSSVYIVWCLIIGKYWEYCFL